MLRPDTAIRSPQALTPVQPVRPTASPSGSNFAATFGAMQREVSDFIANGSHDAALPALSSLSPEGQALRSSTATAGTRSETQQAFVATIAPELQEAADRLGVAPELVAAHAALESGWGQRPLRHADGSDTHNLFGLKATPKWQGEVAMARTTEVEAGTAVARTEPFRSYPDQASAFRDYAQMLLDNPRYRGALNAGGDARAFANGLARGGYATDPAYADKLARVASQLQASPALKGQGE